MPTIKTCEGRRLSPSQLARKILCKAYLPEEFPRGLAGLHLRWRHSDEMVAVQRLLFAQGFCIMGLEVPINGGRLDILAIAPDRRKIAVEVKSHKGEFRELDKIQAALYWNPQFEKIAVANRRRVLFLTPDYIQEVKVAGEIAQEAMNSQPRMITVSFTPHQDVCRNCRNSGCPYLHQADKDNLPEGER